MPRTLTVNVSRELVEALDAIVARHRPWVSRHLVHRLALQLGLEGLSKDAELVANLLQDQEASPGADNGDAKALTVAGDDAPHGWDSHPSSLGIGSGPVALNPFDPNDPAYQHIRR